MELCGASALAWRTSISPPLHSSPHLTSVCEFRRVRVWCVKTDVNGSSPSLKGNQMTVSITGATGFIGTKLVQRLFQDNHSICVLTRSRSKAQSIFPDSTNLKVGWPPSVSLWLGGLRARWRYAHRGQWQ